MSRRKSSDPQLRKYSIYPDVTNGTVNKAFNGVEINGSADHSYEGRRDFVSAYFDSDSSAYSRKYSVALKTLKPFRPSSKDGKIPINKAGFFSYLLMTWISPLVWTLYRKRNEQLSEDDIWSCSDPESCEINKERLKRVWQNELDKYGPEKSSVFRVWLKFSQTRILMSLFFVSINALSTFLESGYLLNLIIAYIESPGEDLGYGLGLVAGMICCQFVRATSFCVIIMFGVQTGVRFRAGFLGVAYDKLLKLKSLRGKSLSEMINIFSSDAYRVYLNCVTFVYLLALPVYLVIGVGYLYYLIDLWSLIAIGLFIVCYTLQAILTNVVSVLRIRTLLHTDRRVRKMTEVINSMKLIKMYAWEKPFQQAVMAIRKVEKKFLLISAIINSITSAIIPVTPTLASVATIAAYTGFGNPLTASTAFAIVGTLNFLKIIVAFVPFASRTIGEARVSFARLKGVLLMDEFEAPLSNLKNEENVVEILNATFMWDSNEGGLKTVSSHTKSNKANENGVVASEDTRSSIKLQNLNLEVKRGRLIGICGQVGCGKTSLLSAILGRMPLISGHLAVKGSVAYAAQQAWIFNGTVRDNILFGKSYDPKWYQTIIHVCGLEPDFAMLANGDETEIGDRGTNLSGGQKQRVSLARAAYSDSEIYLLDDVLSAVDVHVGRHLFQKCIKQTLKGKTVILNTHQLQYLKYCDEIIVMEEGELVEHGDHDELLSQDGYYNTMMNKFYEQTSTEGVKGNKEEKRHQETAREQNGKDNDEKNGKIPEMGKLHSEDVADIARGKLTEDEEMSVGDISFGTYKSYMNAAGGYVISFLCGFFYLVTMGIVVFSDYWLSVWIQTFESATVPGTFDNASVWNLSSVQIQNFNKSVDIPYVNVGLNNTVGETPAADTESGGLDLYLSVYIGSLGAIIVLTICKGFVGAVTFIKAANNLHDSVLVNVMKAPMRFFDANPPGRILNRFSKDLDEADVFLTQLLDSLLQISFSVVLSLAVSGINLPWGFIAMVPVFIVYAIFKTVSSVSVRQMKRVENIARSPLLSHVNTSAQGLSTIVTYNQQDNFLLSNQQFTDVSSTATFLFDSCMRWIGLRLDLSSSVITFSVALALIFTKGTIDPASAGLSLSMCIRVVSVMQFLVRIINEVEARFTSIERLHQYEKGLESESEVSSIVPADNWPNEGRIIFSNVEMKYRKDMEPVLKNIRFDIHPKQKIGIVGRTGAGKSSLAAALFRLNELSGGHIYIDGTDISKIPLHQLRAKLSSIPQDPVLFAGTMRYNLDPLQKYNDDEIWSALENVHLKEKVLQFDKQLDFQIEENGENFSVGERQLICLARAILRRNKILLLDEATASIDTSTDAMIQETIRNSFGDCTVLTIAHRLNTVLHCDQIIIMDSGQVMEMGTPQDLLSDPYSFFNSMMAAQTVKTPSP